MKKIYSILILFSILFLNQGIAVIQADIKKQDPIIDQYKKIGYLEAEGVVKEFEETNKVSVNLPDKFPFKITHRFAKIDEEGKLQLYYLNCEDKQVIKVFITLDKDYFEGPGKEVALKNNYKAVIKDMGEIKRIDFLKNNLAYSISYNKKQSPDLTNQNLIDITNSIK